MYSITCWNSLHIFKLFILCLMLLLASCTNTSAINIIEKTKINGSLSAILTESLPPESKIHILVRNISSSHSSPKVIAEHTLSIAPSAANIPYSIEVPTKSIIPNQKYTIQACVTVEGKVRLLSGEKNQELTRGDNSVSNISLTSVISLSENSNLNSWTNEDNTTLYNSIQSNLTDICHNISSHYEKLINVKASEVLSEELRSGKHFSVEELISIRGPQYLFKVTSDFGNFTVRGLPMLRRIILEIRAMAIIDKIEKSEEFSQAFSDEALEPFGELKELILHPIDRLYGAVKGIGTFISSSSASLTQKRSHYEDRYLEALLSVSKFKRQYSKQLGIDPYSSNAELQKRLNKISWASALGSWVPNILLQPISSPAKLAYSSLNWQETLNRVVTEETPDSLRFSNKKILQSMNVDNKKINQFLSHQLYTPRHHTVIVNAFKSMDKIKGVNSFIQKALTIKTDSSALVFQQIAELLAGYHHTQEAITEIKTYKGIPFGATKSGNWVMLLPIDIGRWSYFSETIFTGFHEFQSEQPNIRKTVWITGESTYQFRQELNNMEITLMDSTYKVLPLLD